MRPLRITGRPSDFAPVEEKVRWLMLAMDDVILASQQDAAELGDPFELANMPADGLYSFDVTTATLADLRLIVGTILQDMKKRGRFAGAG